MSTISKHILGTLNFITFILSLITLIAAAFFYVNPSSPPSQCDQTLHTPLLILSAAVTLVSLAGFLGTCCRIRWLLLLYLTAMLLLILLTIGFYVFAFVMTTVGDGREVAGRGYKEYFLEDYAGWLRRTVAGGEKWSGVRSCLAESEVCPAFGRKYGRDTVDQFYNAHLNTLQSGCCKPPSECEFTYTNPTNWMKGVDNGSLVTGNQDCATWNNDDLSVLCYDCDSCKAAFLDTFKILLRRSMIIAFVFIGFLITIYVMGYLAFRDAMMEQFYDVVMWGGGDQVN